MCTKTETLVKIGPVVGEIFDEIGLGGLLLTGLLGGFF